MNFLFWLLIKIFLLGGDAGDFDSWGDRGGSGIIKYVNYTKVKRACLELARIRQPIVEGVSELKEKDQAHIPKKTVDFTHTHIVPAFPAVLAVPSKQAVHTWLQRLGGTNSARPVLPSGSCNGPLLPGPTDSKWLVVKFCPRRNERVLKCGSSAHLLRSKAGDGRL